MISKSLNLNNGLATLEEMIMFKIKSFNLNIGAVAILFCVGVQNAIAQGGVCMDAHGATYDTRLHYDPAHACYQCSAQLNEPVCIAWNEMIIINSSANSDLVISPHRGAWGFPQSKGAPENSKASIQFAATSGSKYIEIDVTQTLSGGLVLNHFFNLKGADWKAAGFDSWKYNPREMSLATLENIQLLLRDQTIDPTSPPSHNFYSLRDALIHARDNHYILLIDAKLDEGQIQSIDFPDIYAEALNTAYDNQALANIAIKVYGDNQTLESNVSASSYLNTDYFQNIDGKFFWIPITSGSITAKTQAETLLFITDWDTDTSGSLSVAFYETNIYSPTWWGGKEFIDTGIPYKNLMDFATKWTGRRGALWSLDPAGNRGTLSRVHTWKFIGNTPDDLRGDVFTTMNYKGAENAVITTDRPYFFWQFEN